VLSHGHSDHVGGAASAIAALHPEWYIDPGYASGSGPYRRSLLTARDAHTRWARVRAGDSLVVDEVVVTWLAPDSIWPARLSDANNSSTVARIRVGDVAILMTGDAEEPEEAWLVANQRELLKADVLKVGHHGSNTSSSPAFLDAVRPRLALVSVGAGNMYKHPSPSVMDELAMRGVMTLRTDQHGSLVVRTDGHRIELEARGERFAVKR
jgi:competence protein ComEC